MASHQFECNGEATSSGPSSDDYLGSRCYPLPFLIAEYIEQYGSTLEDKGFYVMHLKGDMPRILNVFFGSLQDTAWAPV